MDWLQSILSPSPLGLAIAVLLAISIPIFLHSIVFRASGLTSLPSILLVGPSGSGKTSLVTLFERGTIAETHTSQSPLAVECSLPVGKLAGSERFRSDNDPSNEAHKKFLLVDTPGHGKLRHLATRSIANPQALKGLIFLLDAATISPGSEGLRHTADYLHDILLMLQKRVPTGKGAKAIREISMLIAANKMDLFTALPTALVKSSLESEITKVRVSRSKGLLDSGIGMEQFDDDESDDWLGQVSSTEFKFSQMEEFNISIEVAGGNIVGSDGPSIERWWNWISQRL